MGRVSTFDDPFSKVDLNFEKPFFVFLCFTRRRGPSRRSVSSCHPASTFCAMPLARCSRRKGAGLGIAGPNSSKTEPRRRFCSLESRKEGGDPKDPVLRRRGVQRKATFSSSSVPPTLFWLCDLHRLEPCWHRHRHRHRQRDRTGSQRNVSG